MTPVELREKIACAMRERWRDNCDVRDDTLEWQERDDNLKAAWAMSGDVDAMVAERDAALRAMAEEAPA